MEAPINGSDTRFFTGQAQAPFLQYLHETLFTAIETALGLAQDKNVILIPKVSHIHFIECVIEWF